MLPESVEDCKLPISVTSRVYEHYMDVVVDYAKYVIGSRDVGLGFTRIKVQTYY